MIVCFCNVLTDHDVRSAMSGTDELPRPAHQVYGCLMMQGRMQSLRRDDPENHGYCPGKQRQGL
jgi:hypothetical protein